MWAIVGECANGAAMGLEGFSIRGPYNRGP